MPIDDPVLRDDWHPVARHSELEAGKPLGVRLLDADAEGRASGVGYRANYGFLLMLGCACWLHSYPGSVRRLRS